MSQVERIQHANDVILSISRYGRHFFRCSRTGAVAHFVLDDRNRLRFVDEASRRAVLIVKGGEWRGFTNGGTMRALVEDLAEYIKTGRQIRNHFGPWPEWVCGGDLWGYGDDCAANVRAEVRINPAFAAGSAPASREGQET